MKRALFFVFSIGCLFFTFGQYKYVITQNTNIVTTTVGAEGHFAIYAGGREILYERTPNININGNLVFETSAPITQIKITIGSSGAACFGSEDIYVPISSNGCEGLPNIPNISCLNVNIPIFGVYEMPTPKKNVGNDDLILECKTTAIKPLGDLHCTNLKYAVEYILNDGVPKELLGFGYHNASRYDFDPKTIGEFKVGQTKRLIIRYQEEKEDFYRSAPLNLSLIACSPNLATNPPTVTNVTCPGANNGEVNLSFETNVDENNGYVLRAFVYEGSPGEFTGDLDDPRPPQATYNAIFDGASSEGHYPLLSWDGVNFIGNIEKFEGSKDGKNYYIVYQEVKYDGVNVQVKGGQITDQFTIYEPSPLVISNVTPDHPLCTGQTGSISATVSGGEMAGATLGPLQLGYRLENGPETWVNAAANGNVVFQNLAPGDYTLLARRTINDKICTFEGADVTIDNVPNTVLTLDRAEVNQNPSAPGVNNGIVFVSINNGVGPFTYTLFNTSGTNIQEDVSGLRTHSFTNLGEGSYYVTVEDANCEVQSGSFDVTAIPKPTLGTPTVNVPVCNGEANGSLSVPVTGGMAPYQYRWLKNGVAYGSPEQGNSPMVINNLESGKYVLQVASNGAITTENGVWTTSSEIDVIDPEAVSFTASANPIRCNGANDGSISINPVGGSGYEYNLDGSGNWLTLNANTITGLAYGNHSLQIRNQNGCTSGIQFNLFIDEPNALRINLDQIQNVSTYGGSDGVLGVTVSGGNQAYSYNWTGPNGFSGNSAVINYRVAGDYTLVVTDSKGCTQTETYTITQPEELRFSGPETITEIDCKGKNTGAIQVFAVGQGTLTYTWTFNGTAYGGNVSVLENLLTGTYRVEISDETGASISQTFFLGEPADVLSATALVTNASCYGAIDGQLQINATGGNGGYTFSINGSTFQASANFPGLGAGIFNIRVRDAKNCEFSFQENVGQPQEISINLISQNHPTQANGSDGSLGITAQGGAGGLNYAWTGPNGFVDTSAEIENLEEGDYSVTVTDANGCTAMATYTLQDPQPLAITGFTTTDILCNNEATGSISVQYTGNPPYVFNWERDGQALAADQGDLTDLVAGTYTLTLDDSSSATPVTASVTLTEPALALTGSAVSTATLCADSNDGSLTISAEGGTTPYTYSNDNGASFQGGGSFQNLGAGTYDLIIRDANGCTFSFQESVGQPTEISINLISLNDPTQANGSDGRLAIEAQGGADGFNYAWTGPNGFVATSALIQNLEDGDYTVTVTDANGCTAMATYTLQDPQPLAITGFTTTDILCKNEATGSISVQYTGNPPYVFTWERDGQALAVDQGDLTDLVAGTYTLTLDDSSSATPVTASVTLTEPALVLTGSAVSTATLCADSNDGSLTISAEGGTAPYTYSNDNGASFQGGGSFQNLGAEIYDLAIRDANGCTFFFQESVGQPQTLDLILDLRKDVSENGVADGAIEISISGGTAPYNYQWSGDNGFSSDQEDITALDLGTYTVVVTDANGCNVTDTFVIAEPGELIVHVEITTPLECYGDAFGAIEATASGGVTPYTYTWFKITLNGDLDMQTDNPVLGSLETGDYFLELTDANGIIRRSQTISLSQPDELRIIVDQVEPVLCFGAATGGITTHIEGGTAPYQLTWLHGGDQAQLTDLPAATYTLEVIDAFGCFQALDIEVPHAVEAMAFDGVSTTPGSAYQANDGAISVEISGGQLPYSYNWTRFSDNTILANTPNISGLRAGDYGLEVTDANGCTLADTFTVTEPNIVEETLTQPSCHGSCDGRIELSVNKGNGNFGFSWNTGATSAVLENLCAGTYTVTISGLADGTVERTYTLLDPEPLAVDLGEDRFLCQDQSAVFDVSYNEPGTQYSWTSDTGFSSSDSQIEVSESGTYGVTVITATGCTATGSVSVTVSTDEISAEFALSSQAFVGEEVYGVDISYPLPDTVTWIVPEEAQVLVQNNDEVGLVFDTPGEYEIVLHTQRGNCDAYQSKKVIVVEKDIENESGENTTDPNTGIQEFILFPNPSPDGRFTAQVTTGEPLEISIKVFSLTTNHMIAHKKRSGDSTYEVPFDIATLPSGVYAVLLETKHGKSLRKLVRM